MKTLTCIVCPNGCNLTIEKVGEEWVVKGNLCPKGKEFAVNEMTNPKRSISSTVRTIFKNMPRLPVRTSGEIPKNYIMSLMKEINKIELKQKVHSGDIIVENILGTGVNVIATSDMYLWIEGEE